MKKQQRGAPRGERNGNAKLSDKDRAAIKRSRRSAMALAAQYGVWPSTIARIRGGK